MTEISKIEEIIEDAKKGKMFLLVDSEDRENEGDLIIPAQKCTPEAISFMAKFGRGLICLCLTEERVKKLKLPLMNPKIGEKKQQHLLYRLKQVKILQLVFLLLNEIRQFMLLSTQIIRKVILLHQDTCFH